MMKTRRLGMVLWLLVLFSPALSPAEVFQWTDSRGVIHFTDSLDSVPEPLRDSPSLIIRKDLDAKRASPEIPNQAENTNAEPATAPKAPEVARLPEPDQKTAAPPNIHYNPQPVTIVVVNSTVHHPRKHRCPSSEGCQGTFRPNFDDRRFVHPSVFNGGSRQFVQPELSPPARR